MKIRKLKPEENVHKLLLHSTCFLDFEPEDRYEWLKDPMAHSEGYENAWGGFLEDGTLCSCVEYTPLDMQFNNRPVSTGIVSGVATLPEARNKGFVREMLKSIFTEMKDNGQIFSFVYPFSYSYYRKFGYEQSYTRYQAEIPISSMVGYPYPDGVKSYRKGGDFSDFAAVYNAFIRDKNMAILRDSDAWQEILDRDPHLKREYTYLHYSEQGEADAYILYKPEELNGDGGTLLVQELAWSTPCGLHAMLGFIHGLRTEYENMKWEYPNCVDVFSLFAESWEISIGWTSAGMSRIVDLPKVLELLDAPTANGQVVIDVSDAFLPWNTGKYLIAWEDGKLSVSHTDMPADMETNIEVLTQLVTGYISPTQALAKKGIRIHSKMDNLTALFPKKYMYMMEHY